MEISLIWCQMDQTRLFKQVILDTGREDEAKLRKLQVCVLTKAGAVPIQGCFCVSKRLKNRVGVLETPLE